MSRQFEEFKRIICEFNFDNTYKVAWAKALIELSSELPIAEEQTRITISQIAQKYMQYYWDLLICNDLPQSSNSQKPPEVVTTIKNLIKVYYDFIGDQTPDYFRNAETIIPKDQLEAALKKVIRVLKKDVSYRFLMLDRKKTDVYAYSKGDRPYMSLIKRLKVFAFIMAKALFLLTFNSGGDIIILTTS